MNPQPPDLESGALPIELHPFVCFLVHPVVRAGELLLARFLVNRVFSQFWAVLFKFQPLGTPSFLYYAIIAKTGFCTFKPNVFASHRSVLLWSGLVN